MQVPSGCTMTGEIIHSADVVELEYGGLRLRGGVSGDLGCGGRSVMVRDSGRDDDDDATASASTCRMPFSVNVHLRRLAST